MMTSQFSVSADYSLDTKKQVRTLWPDLFNNGGFVIHCVQHPVDADSTASFAVGNMVVFHLEGPAERNGTLPMSHGMVMSVPIQGQQLNYRVEMDDRVMLDLNPDICPAPTKEFPGSQHTDPAVSNPIHPWHLPGMKPGQAVTCHSNGQRQLGHLQLMDNFQWCLAQCKDRGQCVTEIDAPPLLGHPSNPRTPNMSPLLQIPSSGAHCVPGGTSGVTLGMFRRRV